MAASLVSSLAIYALFRSGALLHGWLAAADVWDWLPAAREAARVVPVPQWVAYSLPDALWQLAFCVLLYRVWWFARRGGLRTTFLLVPTVAGVGCEIGQAFAVIDGVFDPIDLALTFAAIVIAGLLVAGVTKTAPETRRWCESLAPLR